MLVNGGELDGKRILGPKTVALFSINHTPEEALPYGFIEHDLYHAGYGYSLGTRVLMDVSKTGLYGSVGEFGWDGAFATYFWVDPKEELIWFDDASTPSECILPNSPAVQTINLPGYDLAKGVTNMPLKIAMIGAGSIGFTRRLMHDLLAVPEFADTTFAH